MTGEITLVDRGRGLQLSTSRITVMDLVQYFRGGCSYDEIRRWIPSLSVEEISVVDEYYREHKGDLDEADDRVRKHREELIRRQRERFPESNETPGQRIARMRERLHQLHPETNGEGPPR